LGFLRPRVVKNDTPALSKHGPECFWPKTQQFSGQITGRNVLPSNTREQPEKTPRKKLLRSNTTHVVPQKSGTAAKKWKKNNPNSKAERGLFLGDTISLDQAASAPVRFAAVANEHAYENR
jgi:hypothetical protein